MSAVQAATGPTYSQVLVEALTRYKDRTAFVLGRRRLTYGQTADLTSRIQQVLAAHGIERHGAVAVLAPNLPEAWMCQTAIYLLGAHYTGLHPLASLSDQVYICDDAEIEVLIVHPAHAETGAAVLEQSRTIKHVLSLGDSALGRDLLALCEDVQAKPLSSGPATAEDLAWLTYTGGTTGRPKGVMLSQRAMAHQVVAATSWGIPDAPRYLAAAPITHASGLPIVPVLARGGSVVLLQGFDPHGYLEAIQDEHVNFGFIVPTMLYALLDNADPHAYDLSSVDTIVYGAAPITPTRLAEAIETFGRVFAQGYGQTECVGMATSLRKDEHDPVGRPNLLSSCGRAVQGVTVDILDDDGGQVDMRAVGEMCVRSPVVMSGYWKQPELTTEAFRSGWLRTGDLAQRDEDGFFHLVDRSKDLIISGGYNIYPREVEDAIAQDPDISSVAVIGVPDPRWGEAVTAIVVARADKTLDTEALRERVRTLKGPLHAPKRVDVVDALPMTALGKIDKKALRAQYAARHEG